MAAKAAGSRRAATASASSLFAPSAPATSAKVTRLAFHFFFSNKGLRK